MDIAGAQALVDKAANTLKEAIAVRDKMIADAHAAGSPHIDGPSHVTELRLEVMSPGVVYEDLIEDDQMFVDHEVGRLARARGISLA